MDENGDFVYSGNVGTGFTHADRQELEAKLSDERIVLETVKPQGSGEGTLSQTVPVLKTTTRQVRARCLQLTHSLRT